MTYPTVLVVEDDESIRECVSALLTFEGFHVLKAVLPEDGIATLEQLSVPCVVLPDWLFRGDTDGQWFLDRVKQKGLGSRCSVLLFTATNMPEMPGVVGVVRKPTDVQDLLQAIRAADSELRASA